MNTESNTQQIAAVCKEQWILQGIDPWGWGTSTIGLNEDFLRKVPDPEDLAKVVKIFEQRERIKQHSLVTTVIGDEDFLPLSFLQRGAKQGAAVCRIARYFSRQSFQEFIEELQKAVAKWGTTERFNTVAKLKEIFLIPDSVAQEIFSLPNPAENIAPWNEIQDADKLLENLQALTESQLAKINPIPVGTGFLVGGTHLLTNHHVLPSAKLAEECVAQFNYEDDEDDRNFPQDSIDYEFDPKTLFVTEPSLDYTLVQLKSSAFDRQAGYRMGWIQLIEDDATICPGVRYLQFWENVLPQDVTNKLPETGLRSNQRFYYMDVQAAEQSQGVQTLGTLKGTESGDLVFIIQHPKGRRKQISIGDNNKVIDYGLFKSFLRYGANTDYGSSGSPVFNAQWQLVALHHAAIPKIVSKKDDYYGEEQGKPAEIVAQQGVRIFSIIGDLKKKSLQKLKLKSFIQDFVITAEQLNCPPLPTAARLNGGMSGIRNGYFDCGAHESLDVNEAITFEAWVAKQDDENGVLFYRSNNSYGNRSGDQDRSGYWVWWIQGKIRVELLNSENSHVICDTIEPAPKDGLWHHIAFTWSMSQGPKIYIDGEQEETMPVEWQVPLQSLNIPDGPLWIGAGEIGLGIGNPQLGGAIAEVRLWNTVRSETQIKETMYRRLTGDDRKEGLIGYWQFEEDRASHLYVYNLASPDAGSEVLPIKPFSSSSNNPPQLEPQFGLELNGVNEYIDCGSFTIDKAITFEAWVKSTGISNEKDSKHSFIAGQGGGFLELGYTLRWVKENDGDTVEVGLGYQHSPFLSNPTVISPVVMQDAEHWHHVAFTWSKDSSRLRIYIDGKLQAEELFDGPVGPSVSNLFIGRNKANVSEYFQGAIAEVRLWNIARSEDQIVDAMNRMLNEDEINGPTLEGYWPLNEVAGSEASNLVNKDSVENQPGLVYGGTWLKPKYLVQPSKGTYSVPCGDVKWLKASECPSGLLLPCGLKFNSEGNQVICGADSSLDVIDAITVEAWVKHWFGNCLIVSRGGCVDDGYSLCWQDGKIRVMLQDKAMNQKVIVDTEENAPVDQVWHHIAFTWDKTSQEIVIYVDGRQQDCVVMEGQAKSISYAGQTKSTALFIGSLTNLKTDLVIGCKTKEAQYYDVTITEVRLWKVARTQDQIKTNMTCRLSCRDDDWKDLLGYWRLDDGSAGNTQARNLRSDSSPGVIQGAQWFPAPPSSASLNQSLTVTENPSSPSPST